ncbi:MAG: IPT/TIG domain-containing protein [Patescibacteria group bacterium]|jgi:cysteine-rich repeat protein
MRTAKNNIFRSGLAAIAGFAVLLSARAVSAQVDLGLDYATAIGLTTTDVRTTVARIISYFLGFLGIIAVGLILYAGFLWMTSQGNEEQISKAKKTMVSAAIGLVIIMSAFAIARFIIGAAGGEVGGGGDGGGGGAGGGNGFGGGATFRVQGVAPAGPNDQRGWSKNSKLKMSFNDGIDAASVTGHFRVLECNPRIQGAGDGAESLPFDIAACKPKTEAYAGTSTVVGKTIEFVPDSKCDNGQPCFKGDVWYLIEADGGATGFETNVLKTPDAKPLDCRAAPGAKPEDTTAQARTLCRRAVAIGDWVDFEPPNVRVTMPKSPPGICSAPLNIQAIAQDNQLAVSLTFGIVAVGEDGAPGAPVADAIIGETVKMNAALANPFSIDTVQIDLAKLAAGSLYGAAASAEDVVGNASAPVVSNFKVLPTHCCNGAKDADEDGVDCGAASACGRCSGAVCTGDADCASGACVAGKCVDLPMIESVSPAAGAPGTLVTVSGKMFGPPAGRVIFLGDVNDPNDDAVADLCAAPEDSWTNGVEPNQATVKVPANAKDGPIEIRTLSGLADTTANDRGWVGTFDVDTALPPQPGICFVKPNFGPIGTRFDISGVNFGGEMGESQVFLSTSAANVASQGWASTGDKITAITPTLKDGPYPVRVRIGNEAAGVWTTNDPIFLVSAGDKAEAPAITEVLPPAGPVDAYITIVGRGFGSSGVVRFVSKSNASDVAIGVPPAPPCKATWTSNYIVVKVPTAFECSDKGTCPVRLEQYDLSVQRSGDGKESKAILFTINSDPSKPGICSIEPDNGPAGTTKVKILGERFGTKSGLTEYSINFSKNNLLANTAVRAYAGVSWSNREVSAYVPAARPDPATPEAETGPVYVEANNQWSSNAVPFKVQDCTKIGGDNLCQKDQPDKPVCCPNGSCRATKAACEAPKPTSAYGWRFSTEVLPEMPQVLRCACHEQTCQAKYAVDFKSPAPSAGSQDICTGTVIQLAFNNFMRVDSFAGKYRIETCGDGIAPACAAAVNVTSQFDVTFENSNLPPQPPGSRSLVAAPKGAGALLAKKTWYRVTLSGDSENGIKDIYGVDLDGDYDLNQGGDYVLEFKTAATDAPCVLSEVIVNPFKYLIDRDEVDNPEWLPPAAPNQAPAPANPAGFAALPVDISCNRLRCAPGIYQINWSSDENILSLQPDKHQCYQAVRAKAETEDPVGLAAAFAPPGGGQQTSGQAEVSVKFADPQVTAHAPDCGSACSNAAIWAQFNVAMDEASFSGNVEVLKCRNISCQPPYFHETVTVNKVVDSVGQLSGRRFEFAIGSAGLASNTNYLVRLRSQYWDPKKDERPAGSGFIKSRSGVPLSKLNDGDYFTWQFKTNTSPTPCAVHHADVRPSAVLLQYVGQRADFEAVPFAKPDECDDLGQQLRASAYSWLWTKTDKNVIDGFYTNSGSIDPPAAPDVRLDTNMEMMAGCTSDCRHTGSQNKMPQCGNGVVDLPWEDPACDAAVGSPATRGCDASRCVVLGTLKCGALDDAQCCGNGQLENGENCEAIIETEPAGCKLGDAGCSAVRAVFDTGCQEPNGSTVGCVMLGAAAGKSSCGDGQLADGEACDDGNRANGDGCSNNCLREGSLPSCLDVAPDSEGVMPSCVNYCGNGRTEAGEDIGCDTASGAGASDAILAAGCDPKTCLRAGTKACAAATGTGCCRNGIVEAGEQCDDGNLANQDGCSAACLLEGASAQYSEMSFCRDGVVGAGEAAGCDPGPVGGDGRIDPFQIIRAGVYSGPPVARPSDDVLAGLTEFGSDSTRVGKATVSLTCSCLEQSEPQTYCRSLGEMATEDPAPPPLGCSANGCCAPAPVPEFVYPLSGQGDVCRNTAVKVAFSEAVDINSVRDNVGVYEPAVDGACRSVCSNDPGKTCTNDAGCGGSCIQAKYCADTGERCQINSDCSFGVVCAARPAEAPSVCSNNGLACVANADCGGSCRPVRYCVKKPGQQCSTDADCGEGDTCADRQPVNGQLRPWGETSLRPEVRSSAWWQAPARLISFLFDLLERAVSPVRAADAGYCRVPGDLVVKPRLVTFMSAGSYLPNVTHTILLRGADGLRPAGEVLRTAGGVPLYDSSPSEFKTAGAVCKIDSVVLTPVSHLFTTAEDTNAAVYPDPEDSLDGDQNFVAEAKPARGGDLASLNSTPDYRFKWFWDVQPDDSPIVVAPTVVGPAVGNGFCEIGEADNSPDCKNCAAASDCVRSRPEETETARVSVRKTPVEKFPANGDQSVRVAAEILDQGLPSTLSAESRVTVMLCRNPWPSWRKCTDVQAHGLPWDAARGASLSCLGDEQVWFPFYDPTTNLSFYYCRDGAAGGDEGDDLPALNESGVKVLSRTSSALSSASRRLAQAGAASSAPRTPAVGFLPALNESKYASLQPGRDIQREYLFTFDRALGPLDPNFPDKPTAWEKNAIGLRIMSNLDHLSISDWYQKQGFSGNPTATTVDGYPALREGRTVYSLAVAKVDIAAEQQRRLYTNVNILSYSDGAAAETQAIFDQILNKINFNLNVSNKGYCVDAAQEGMQALDNGKPIPCSADVDCRVKNGGFDPLRAGLYCSAHKDKLIRDLKRWTDLVQLRNALVAKKSDGYPKLESGTFLPGRTISSWGSWTSVLASELGFGLVADPVNKLMQCSGYCSQYPNKAACDQHAEICVYENGVCADKRKFDPATCWNAAEKVYRCPAESHVYEFQSVGGQDFRLYADFETGQDYLCTAYAEQNTCLAQDGFCNWFGGKCAANAKMYWAGSTCFEVRDGSDPDNTTQNECVAKSECAWSPEAGCQPQGGGALLMSGVNYDLGPRCQAMTEIGSQGYCGDGVVQIGGANPEECEPGQAPAIIDCVSGGRPGVQRKACGLDCRWQAPGACAVGSCGDGIKQSGEFCDDGPLNGTYGQCNSTCNGLGPRCGDGAKQASEACDLGADNGQYNFNGAPSCSWDCKELGPRCGDSKINGSGEVCDGGVQNYPQLCCPPGADQTTCTQLSSQPGCSTNADCRGLGANGQDWSCVKFCDANDHDKRWRRTCYANAPGTEDDQLACRWGDWSCTEAGSCGDGVKNTGEQCDDGNSDAADGCVNCKNAVCGDGFVSAARGEQCDGGALNGQRCRPAYGQDCTYCTSACKLGTVTGGFCGNNILENFEHDPPGPEECEGETGINNWICVSTRPQDQVFGRQTGQASCDAKTCKRTCVDRSSKACNDSSTVNTDSDVRPPQGVWNLFNPQAYLLELPNSWPFPNPYPVAPPQSYPIVLKDSCDPDADNDGVPNSKDCEPLQWDSRPNFSLTYTKSGDTGETGSFSVTEGVEDVCDGRDNNCNGVVDENLMKIRGVFRVEGGRGVVGNAPIKLYCKDGGNLTYLKEVMTAADGSYDISFNITTCAGSEIEIQAWPPSTGCWGGPDIAKTTLAKVADCNPANSMDLVFYPKELCNGKDDDCNSLIDDNWTVRTRPGEGMAVSGNLRDAMFVNTPIVGATVEAQAAVCNYDRVTTCGSDTDCNADTTLNFNNWATQQPDNWTGSPDGNENCAQMYPDGTWNDAACSSTQLADRGVCNDLTVTGTGLNYDSAKSACSNHGGLASIADLTKNEQVRTACNGANCWIGLDDKVTEGIFIWANGKKLGGVCGVDRSPNNIAIQTDASGNYNLADVVKTTGTPAHCRVRLKVLPFKPANNLVVSGLSGAVVERNVNGYHAASMFVPSGSANSWSAPQFYLMPRVSYGYAMAAYIWDGDLNGFLDSYLWVPDPGSATVSYGSPGNQDVANTNPNAFLSCYHPDGRNTCGTFDYAPQTMLYRWNDDRSVLRTWKFWVNDYSGNGYDYFSQVNSRMYISWHNGAYQLTSITAPVSTSNTKGNWYIFDMTVPTSGVPTLTPQNVYQTSTP